MSIFDLSGDALVAEVSRPAPVAVIEVPRLASVLEQIAALGEADQAALLAAFKIATAQRRIATEGKTFKGFDDFMPAYTAARVAAAEVGGELWYLSPAISCKATLPTAWTNCRIFGGISLSPKDVNMPKARFWPGGRLPIGPVYAEHGPLAHNVWLRAARLEGPALELVPPPEVLELREAA